MTLKESYLEAKRVFELSLLAIHYHEQDLVLLKLDAAEKKVAYKVAAIAYAKECEIDPPASCSFTESDQEMLDALRERAASIRSHRKADEENERERFQQPE